MASFSRFWVVTLFLVTVLRGSQLASSRTYQSATMKLLDHPAFIGKNSILDIGEWCVPEDGVPDPQLQANIDFACNNGADCKPIQPGGPCFEPDTLLSHATYAMNSYFQGHGRTLDACSFSGTGMITNKDPSTKHCKYPG